MGTLPNKFRRLSPLVNKPGQTLCISLIELGMSDASGIDLMRIIRIHMFPELIQAQCSMFGAWGPAIAQTNGSLVQLRALDWITSTYKFSCSIFQAKFFEFGFKNGARKLVFSHHSDGPFQEWPAVLVYHPEGNNGHNFSLVGWVSDPGRVTFEGRICGSDHGI